MMALAILPKGLKRSFLKGGLMFLMGGLMCKG
jgi:hypothetical protein